MDQELYTWSDGSLIIESSSGNIYYYRSDGSSIQLDIEYFKDNLFHMFPGSFDGIYSRDLIYKKLKDLKKQKYSSSSTQTSNTSGQALVAASSGSTYGNGWGLPWGHTEWGDYDPSAVEIKKPEGPKCECGTTIALGKEDHPERHSQWCAVFKNSLTK